MKIGSFVLVAIGAFVAGVFYHENKNKLFAQPEEKPTPSPAKKPMTLAEGDSLPANDPPSWTPGELH